MTVPNTPTEIVDLTEARKRLPSAKRLVSKIMESTEEAAALNSRVRERGKEGFTTQEEDELRAEFDALDQRFQTALRELNELGAYLKDPVIGLIDFYTWRDDRIVFLCWRHGEEDIEFWHEINQGFSGRQPLCPADSH